MKLHYAAPYQDPAPTIGGPGAAPPPPPPPHKPEAYVYFTDASPLIKDTVTVNSWTVGRDGAVQDWSEKRVVPPVHKYSDFDTATQNVGQLEALRTQHLADLASKYRESIGYSQDQEKAYRKAAIGLAKIEISTANPPIPSWCKIRIARIERLDSVLGKLDNLSVSIAIAGGESNTSDTTTWSIPKPAEKPPKQIPALDGSAPLVEADFQLMEALDTADDSIVFHFSAAGHWFDPEDTNLKNLPVQGPTLKDLLAKKQSLPAAQQDEPVQDSFSVSRDRGHIRVRYEVLLEED